MKAALLHRKARAWLALLVACGALLTPTLPVLGQEQFFTQSGGRGLQNAKTNARLSKAETEIGVMQEDLRTIKPHARAELGACAADGEKLRFDGTNWVCDQETDPTVQAFAKKALPTCSGGSMLGVVGGELGCSQVGFVTQETDPTVQEFAKQPLPQCASEQLIAVGANNTLRCITDQQGIATETDPRVYDFAKRDAVSVLPNCPPGELLTMVNGRLGCRVDQVGLSVEVDPQVQDFARKDNGQPVLAACANGEVLRATTQGGKVVLACENASGALTETLALNDLSDVITTGQTSGSALTYSNGYWRAMPTLGSAANPLYLSQLGDVQVSSAQSDDVLRWDGTRWVNSNDKLGTLTDTNWCRTVGTEIVCDRPPPLTCNSGELLSWDGTGNTWLCTDAATSIGNAIELNDLGDVSITSVVTGQALRFDGTGWVNSTIERILAGDTQIVATDTGTDGLLSFATDGVTRVAITNEGRVGIGVMPASPYMLDVSGSIRASGDITATNIYGQNGFFNGDLTVRGNLNVSGSQSIDGVIFANGGVALSGTLASGNVSTTYLSATLADIRTLRVTNNQTVGGNLSVSGTSLFGGLLTAQHVSFSGNQTVAGNAAFGGDVRITGNLYVSGSQSIDGVLFANGGIALSGTVTSGNVSTTYLSATLADIRTLRGNALTYTSATFNTAVVAQATLTNVSVTVADIDTLRSTLATLATLNGTQANLTNISGTRVDVAQVLRVSGTTYVQDINVLGNLNVSGSQRIDGVLFANGGIALSGTVTSGNISATNLSATVADIRTLRVTNNQTVGGGVSVTGNVQANTFIGSGASLTNIPASAVVGLNLDRISTSGVSSGPNLAMVVADQGTVSFTLAGNPGRAYLDSTLGLVAPGVSTTGPISGTVGYFSGGVSASQLGLQSGATPRLLVAASGGAGVLFQNLAASGNFIFRNNAGGTLANMDFATTRVGLNTSTATPSATLHVSGTLRISSAGEACDADRIGAIRYSGGDFSVCRNGTAWETLTSIAQGAAGLADRISSGTTQLVVVSDTGFVSLTQAGTNTGWFDPTRGLVTLGVSSTGPISGTNGYFNGNVGVGMAPSGTQRLSLNADATNGGLVVHYNNSASPVFALSAGSATAGAIRIGTSTGSFNINDSINTSIMSFNGLNRRVTVGTFGTASQTLNVAGSAIFTSWTAINFPIGTRATATTPLEVSGTISATTLKTGPGETCASSADAGAIRYSGGALSYCNGTAWQSLANAANLDWYSITSIPTQVQNVSNGTTLSMTWVSSTNLSATTAHIGNLSANAIAANSVSSGLVSASNISGSFAQLGRISSTNVSITNNLTVGGTVTAGAFVGDGSGLTGVIAAGSDRITSGTTQMVVVSTTGFVSLTQAGTNTGWFDPTRGLVTLGVSATGTVSATAGFLAGPLQISQTVNTNLGGITIGVSSSGVATGYLYANGANNLEVRLGGTNGQFQVLTTGGTRIFQVNDSFDYTNMLYPLLIGGNNTTPVVALQVSGTLRVANGGEACDASRIGAMRFTGGDFSVCRNGTAWETFTSIAQGAAGLADRISSGTTQLVVVSNTGFVSLTQAGTNTGWFDPTRGLVTLGVSSTGGISGTTGYFSGNVGIGTTAPAYKLDIFGAVDPVVRIKATSTGSAWLVLEPAVTGDGILHNPTSQSTVLTTNGVERMRITVAGNIGVSTSSPATRLDVNGSIRIANGGEACDGTTAGAIRYSGGVLSFCNGTAWTALGTAGSADWYGITNIPTQVQNVSNGTTLTMNLVSTTNLSATTAQIGNLSANGIAANSVSSGLVSATNISGSFAQLGRISSTNVSITNNLTVGGTVTAGAFVGDGSGLTNLSVSGDRITSGTSNAIVNSTTGVISFTQLGVATGYLHPTIGLVAPGLSTTGPISGTNAYFNSTVGLGVITPSNTLHISGTMRIDTPAANSSALDINSPNSSTSATIRLGTTAGKNLILNTRNGNVTIDAGLSGGSNLSMRLTNSPTLAWLSLQPTGNIGIGGFPLTGSTANTALHVSGTLLVANGGEACDASRIGAIRFTAGDFSVCRNGSAWETFTSIAQGAAGLADRITSGTTSVVAQNNNAVSITIAGSNVANFGSGGLGITNINASGAVSVTGTGYFSGSVGVGMAPSDTQALSINTSATSSGLAIHYQGGASPVYYLGAGSAGAGTLRLAAAGNSFAINNSANQAFVRFLGSNSAMLVGAGVSTASQTLHVNGSALITSWTAINFGTGTRVTATAPLEVSGTISATTLKTGPGESCASSADAGAIRYSGGALSFCNGSTWTTLGSAGSADWYGITNIPTQVQNVSNGTTLSMSLVSASNISGTLAQITRVSSTNISATNISTTRLTVNGVDITGGGGATRLASLTDVSLSNLTGLDILRYNGTSWTNVNVQNAISTTTMVADWPDAIICDDAGTMRIMTLWGQSASAATYVWPHAVNFYYITYSSSGNYSSQVGTPTWDCVTNAWSIGQLYAAGRAFNFIGGSGTTSPTVDRIISGTSNAIVNSATGVISFTQLGTATAYLHPTLGLVAPGVSTTGTVSATNFFTAGLLTAARVTATNISATNISTTRLTVNGVDITGGGNADRIVSGTTTLVAVSNTGFVSLTQAGTNTGWFDPTRGLVTLGVSATGGISGTTGYFSGNVGIGTTSPAQRLHVVGTSGVPSIGASNTGIAWFSENTGSNGLNVGVNFNGGTPHAWLQSQFIGGVAAYYTLALNPLGGGIGIGTASPTTRLDVNGTIRIANGGEACNGTTAGAIRYSGGALSFCNGTAWTTLGSAGAADWYGLTNIPTQVQNVSNGTTLTMSLVSSTNLSATTAQMNSLSANAVAANSVSGTNISATNISTTRLTVNGVDITGGGNADRIVSGTTNILANNNTSLTFTTAGTQRMIVGATGNVGIGTTSPGRQLEISGSAPALRLRTAAGTSASDIAFDGSTLFLTNYALGDLGLTTGNAVTFFVGGAERVRVNAAGSVGIGTVNPGVSLTVVGEVQVSSSGVTCNGTTAGAIRYSGGALSFCNGTAWTTLGSAGAADWYGITNIPTQVQNVSNGTVISMSHVSATNVSASALQLGGTGTCTAATAGMMRYTDIGGGVMKLQLCRP